MQAMSMTSDAEVERGISVTMDGGRVVIRPSGHLDRETLDALLGLVAGARRPARRRSSTSNRSMHSTG